MNKTDLLNEIKVGLDKGSLEGVHEKFYDYMALSSRNRESLKKDFSLKKVLLQAWNTYTASLDKDEVPSYLNNSLGENLIKRLMIFYAEGLETTDALTTVPFDKFISFSKKYLQNIDYVDRVTSLNSIDIQGGKVMFAGLNVNGVEVELRYTIKNIKGELSVVDVNFDHSYDTTGRFDNLKGSQTRTINRYGEGIKSHLGRVLSSFLHDNYKGTLGVKHTRYEDGKILISESNTGAGLDIDVESTTLGIHGHILKEEGIFALDTLTNQEYGILLLLNNFFISGSTVITLDGFKKYHDNFDALKNIINKFTSKGVLVRTSDSNGGEYTINPTITDVLKGIDRITVDDVEASNTDTDKKGFSFGLKNMISSSIGNIINTDSIPNEIEMAKNDGDFLNNTIIPFGKDWTKNDLRNLKDNLYAHSDVYLKTLASRLYMELYLSSTKLDSANSSIEKLLTLIQSSGLESLLTKKGTILLGDVEGFCNKHTYKIISELCGGTISTIKDNQRNFFEENEKIEGYIEDSFNTRFSTHFGISELEKHCKNKLWSIILEEITEEIYTNEVEKQLISDPGTYSSELFYKKIISGIFSARLDEFIEKSGFAFFRNENDVKTGFGNLVNTFLGKGENRIDPDVCLLFDNCKNTKESFDAAGSPILFKEGIVGCGLKTSGSTGKLTFELKTSAQSYLFSNKQESNFDDIIKQISIEDSLNAMQKSLALFLFVTQIREQLQQGYGVKDFSYKTDESSFDALANTFSIEGEKINFIKLFDSTISLTDRMNLITLILEANFKGINNAGIGLLDKFEEINFEGITEDVMNPEFSWIYEENEDEENSYLPYSDVTLDRKGNEIEINSFPEKQSLLFFSFHKEGKFTHFFFDGKFCIAKVDKYGRYDTEDEDYAEYQNYSDYFDAMGIDIKVMKKYMNSFISMYMKHPSNTASMRHIYTELPDGDRVEIAPGSPNFSVSKLTKIGKIEETIKSNIGGGSEHVSVLGISKNPLLIVDLEKERTEKTGWFKKVKTTTSMFDYNDLEINTSSITDFDSYLGNPDFAESLMVGLVQSLK